jgi:hypothetical protein
VCQRFLFQYPGRYSGHSTSVEPLDNTAGHKKISYAFTSASLSFLPLRPRPGSQRMFEPYQSPVLQPPCPVRPTLEGQKLKLWRQGLKKTIKKEILLIGAGLSYQLRIQTGNPHRKHTQVLTYVHGAVSIEVISHYIHHSLTKQTIVYLKATNINAPNQPLVLIMDNHGPTYIAHFTNVSMRFTTSEGLFRAAYYGALAAEQLTIMRN